MQFDGALASLTPAGAHSRIAHLLSRQCLIDSTTAAQAIVDGSFQPISHDRRRVFRPLMRVFRPLMDKPGATDLRTRGLKRIAVTAGMMLLIFIVFAVAIHVGVRHSGADDGVTTPTQRVRHSSWV